MRWLIALSAIITGGHLFLLFIGKNHPWVIYNLALGLFLMWVAWLISTEQDKNRGDTSEVLKQTENSSSSPSSTSPESKNDVETND